MEELNSTYIRYTPPINARPRATLLRLTVEIIYRDPRFLMLTECTIFRGTWMCN